MDTLNLYAWCRPYLTKRNRTDIEIDSYNIVLCTSLSIYARLQCRCSGHLRVGSRTVTCWINWSISYVLCSSILLARDLPIRPCCPPALPPLDMPLDSHFLSLNFQVARLRRHTLKGKQPANFVIAFVSYSSGQINCIKRLKLSLKRWTAHAIKISMILNW